MYRQEGELAFCEVSLLSGCVPARPSQNPIVADKPNCLDRCMVSLYERIHG